MSNSVNTSYLLARAAVATSMLGHGLVRFPKLTAFSQWMTGQFQKSALPEALVQPFSYAVPFIEFAVGLFLLIGLFTRASLVAGGILMILLIFGSSMIEEWGSIPSQLIHAAFFAGLLAVPEKYNHYSADRLLGNR